MAKGKRIGYDEAMNEDVKEEVKEIRGESPAKVETTVPKTVNGVGVKTLNVNVRRWPDKDSEVVETLRA